MDDMNGMSGMNVTNMSPSSASSMHLHNNKEMVMSHMTFFWGKNSEILFSGWPGTRSGIYTLALIFVFVLCVLVEWLSHCRLIKPAESDGRVSAAAGWVQTLLHALRVGLAYLVMLALMSFNGGVFLIAVAGHSLGFLLFGSRLIFNKSTRPPKISSDLPPRSC